MGAAPLVVDTRTIGKIDGFDGTSSAWADWQFKARAWISLLPLAGRDVDGLLQGAESSPNPVDRALLATDIEQFGVILYGILAQCCRGRVMSLIRRVDRGNGWEVWRQLFLEFQPSEPIRHSAMLAGILTPMWESAGTGNFIIVLNEWETRIHEYTAQAGEPVSDTVNISVVLRWAPREVKDLPRGQMANIGNDFSKLKHILLAYNSSGHEWDAAGSRRDAPDTGGSRPMDVGAVTVQCAKCGKMGHTAATCWSKGNSGGKGGGKRSWKRQRRWRKKDLRRKGLKLKKKLKRRKKKGLRRNDSKQKLK